MLIANGINSLLVAINFFLLILINLSKKNTHEQKSTCLTMDQNITLE